MPKKRKRNAGLGNRKKGQWRRPINVIDVPIPPPDTTQPASSNQSNNVSTVPFEWHVQEQINAVNILRNNEELAADGGTNEITNHNENEDDTVAENEVDTIRQKKYFSSLQCKARRWAIFDLFVNKYNGLEPKDGNLYKFWKGKDGVVSKIRKDLKIKSNSGFKMLPIFEAILECQRTGTDFDPSMIERRGGKRPNKIRLDSPEAQIIADGLESGLSIRKTWYNVNYHRQESNKELLSESTVVSAIRRMKPKIVRIEKRKQGSSDPTSHWSIARKLWTTQLLIRFGALDENELQQPIERKFCRREVGALELTQVVWWDETHRKCLIGGLSASKDYAVLFPRSQDGNIDLENGSYSNKKITRLNVKYEKEARLGLGCAMVAPLDQDGSVLPCVGRRCNLFDYSTKVIISLDDYEKKIKTEISRVKKASSSSNWVERTRDMSKVYNDMPLRKLKGCGEKGQEKLMSINIKTVEDLQKISDPASIELPDGITKTKFKVIWESAQKAEKIPTPRPIDHRKSPNPYQSRYGNTWEVMIKKSPSLSSSVVISDYIDHMMTESAKVMLGTKHQDDWVIYHDALSLMTAERTKNWMETKNYLGKWILPSHNLYDNLDEIKKKYKNNPLGNSPEFMPWDAHLNQDVHSSVDYHCLVSKSMADDDPKKFCGSTPKRLAFSYQKILHPTTGVCPSSTRIMQDIKRVALALGQVRLNDGCILEDKYMRVGRRRENAEGESRRGGKRTKKSNDAYIPPVEDMHQDILEARQQQILLALQRAVVDVDAIERNEEGNENESSVDNSSNNESANNDNLEEVNL